MTPSHHSCSSRITQTTTKTTNRQKAMVGAETRYLNRLRFHSG